MKIEIKTTEKKLTQSIVNQMRRLRYEYFDEAEVLGFLILKGGGKKALCYANKDYYLLDMFWERRGHYAGYNTRRGEMQIKLSPDIIDDWFEKYNKLVKQAEEEGHIYI